MFVVGVGDDYLYYVGLLCVVQYGIVVVVEGVVGQVGVDIDQVYGYCGGKVFVYCICVCCVFLFFVYDCFVFFDFFVVVVDLVIFGYIVVIGVGGFVWCW